MAEFSELNGPFGLRGLHKDVYIKIGIIDKNSKNTEKALNFASFWGIVSMHSEVLGKLCAFSDMAWLRFVCYL